MKDETQTSSSVERLRSMIDGFRISQSVYVAARLNIADELARGPRHIDDLARACNADADALSRLLRALVGVDVFAMTETGAFQLTALSQHLRTDSPESIHPWIIAMTDLPWQPWGRLLECVQRGEGSFESVYGMSRYDYLRRHPDQQRWFDRAMASYRGQLSLPQVHDFSSCRTVVDVGGGIGDCLADILEACPGVSGILMEREEVLDEARMNLRARGVETRCRFVSGDFFKHVPDGGDAYILKSVLHNWNDSQALDVLRACHRAMTIDSRLLVVEPRSPGAGDNMNQAFKDLHMLVMHGGRERTNAELATLLSSAGFEVLGHTDCDRAVVMEVVPDAIG